MNKEEEITRILERLNKLDNEQLMFIAGATNAFYLTQQQTKEQKGKEKKHLANAL